MYFLRPSPATSSRAQASQDTTYFIDAEFAFYGPIWFDVGKFLGNLLLSFFSLDGRATEQDGRQKQRKWVVSSIKELWETFAARFVELWDKEAPKVRRLELPPLLFLRAGNGLQ